LASQNLFFSVEPFYAYAFSADAEELAADGYGARLNFGINVEDYLALVLDSSYWAVGSEYYALGIFSISGGLDGILQVTEDFSLEALLRAGIDVLNWSYILSSVTRQGLCLQADAGISTNLKITRFADVYLEGRYTLGFASDFSEILLQSLQFGLGMHFKI